VRVLRKNFKRRELENVLYLQCSRCQDFTYHRLTIETFLDANVAKESCHASSTDFTSFNYELASDSFTHRLPSIYSLASFYAHQYDYLFAAAHNPFSSYD
jgi:hypothetical protein